MRIKRESLCKALSTLRGKEKKTLKRGAWLARLEEHATLDLWIMRASPKLGVEIT